jgi:hypothetical protein
MTTSSSIYLSRVLAARRATDLHLAWLDAEDDAHEAYLTWCSSVRSDRDAAFAVYLAALDREEAAARELQDEVTHLCNA